MIFDFPSLTMNFNEENSETKNISKNHFMENKSLFKFHSQINNFTDYDDNTYSKAFKNVFPSREEVEDYLSTEKEESSKEKKGIFMTLTQKKRGRQTAEGKLVKKVHSGNDFDNIKRAVQVHLFQFLIKLANDAVNCILGEQPMKFLKVNYSKKTKIKEKYLKGIIKRLKYADILKMDISDKYIKPQKDNNKKLLDEVCKKSDILKMFFEQNYLDVFKKYFYNEQKLLKEFYFMNKKIILSSDTKNLYFLLQDDRKRDAFINAIKKVYLD